MKQISPRDCQLGMVRQSNGGGVAEQDRRRKVRGKRVRNFFYCFHFLVHLGKYFY